MNLMRSLTSLRTSNMQIQPTATAAADLRRYMLGSSGSHKISS